MKIFHQNIQSISSKIGEIEVLIDGYLERPSVLCFTEHWCVNTEIEFAKIAGYMLASHCSRANMSHGGSCIFVENGIEYRELRDLTQLSIEGQMECSAVEISNVIVICIYRPSSKTAKLDIFLAALSRLFDELRQRVFTKSLVLCGDFNIDLLVKDRDSVAFIDLLSSFGLKQTIFDPTRVTAVSQTLIDNIFVGDICDINARVVINALSDHYAQEVSIPNEVELKKSSVNNKIRNYSSGKMTVFREELLKCDWSEVLKEENVDIAYNNFTSILSLLSNIIFTYKTVSASSHSWMTQGIRVSSSNKRKMYLQKIRGEISSERYRTYSKILKKVVNLAKRWANESYIKNSRNKSKATWHLISQITHKAQKTKIDLQSTFKNRSFQNTLDDFNKYFINVSSGKASFPLLDYQVENNHCSMFAHPADPPEVYRVIMGLNDTKSVGVDEIPVRLLKFVADLISVPLAYLINLTISQGIFPESLKVSLVHPVFKKGSKTVLDNYRPISIQSNLSKVFEKIISERILKFVEDRHLLTDQQNGFRRGKSTTRALYQVVNEIIHSLNNKNETTAVLLDLSKAFDCVDHNILLNKLERYGIRGISNDLIRSYLSGRKQCVIGFDSIKRKQVRSEYLYAKRGVPQGSVLGPLLFILYTSDLVNIVGEKVVLYADDTSIVFSEKSVDQIKDKMYATIAEITSWFNSNNLKLNVDKTKLIRFTYPLVESDPLVLDFDSVTLRSGDSARLLGVEIDRRLDWRPHIDRLGRKMASFAYALRTLSYSVGRQASKTAYFAYIQSVISYGIIIWGNSGEADRIFILQKKCIRSIYQMHFTDSCRPVFIKEGILTFYSIYILEAIKFITENKLLFKQWERKHNYYTRNKNDLCPVKPNLTYIQNNVHHNIIKIYNKIPSAIKTMNHSAMYKLLKRHFLHRAYYTMDEFYNDSFTGIL